MKNTLLIDGNSVMFSSYYGMPPLMTPDGRNLNAVVGTLNILIKYIKALEPDHCGVAFDPHGGTFRNREYSEYKAGRQRAPQDLIEQFPIIKECLDAVGVRSFEIKDFEADDVLGTLASLTPEGSHAYIVTGDRDSFQLISDRVTVLYKGHKGIVEYDPAAFAEKYPGLTPESFVSYKALLGDTSDNIPGVRGIGEKSALELIAAYGSLDGVYEHIDEISEKKKAWGTKLTEGREDAYFSLFLSRIVRDAPIEDALSLSSFTGPDLASAEPVLTKYGMAKVLENVRQISAAAPEKAPESEKTYVQRDETDLPPFRGSEAPVVALHGAVVFDGENEYLADENAVGALLSDPEKTVAVADAKAMYAVRPDIRATLWDASVADYICDPNDSDHGIKASAFRNLGVSLPENFDAPAVLFDLKKVLDRRISETGQTTIFEKIETPLCRVLTGMEQVGIKIDVPGLREFSEELGKREAVLREEVCELAGREFNVNSPKQLAEVLYDELGLPAPKRGAGGRTTDAESLEGLSPFHPIVDKILEYRKISKLRSTYTDGLIAYADGDARIHTTFNQKVASTGRLSSSDPNLQNIPIRSDLGRRMRKFFISRDDGHVLIDADYSQIELRVLAALSSDAAMTESFLRGEDIHRRTAASVFGVPQELVTPDMRKKAKTVNFGILYGMSAFSLAKDLGVPRYEAQEYISNYLAGFPEISEFLSETIAFADKNGYVTTLFGRRRQIPELRSPKKTVRAAGERIARNSPIQGTAADIIKLAMINVSERLEKTGLDARLVLQIHDELIVESRTEIADEVAGILREEMENAVELGVPLTVETGIGKSWFDCHN
ncbi:MAG: DNA polymerase I [Clostridia bacterium]|nr:DNA polymerase I [Clostridia bacterium]